MSGHSKWSKVKHQKESTDAIKGKLFTKLTKAIIIAVKTSQNNTDPNSNFKLRLAIENAKKFNMPKDNINRALEKSIDRGEFGQLEEHLYEAICPGGIGLIIETTTNNRTRTVSDIKNILERHNASLVESGGVTYLFQHLGLIVISKNQLSNHDFDNFIMEADVLDFEQDDQNYLVYTLPQNLHKIKNYIDKYHIQPINMELIFKPISLIELTEQEIESKVTKIIELLKDNEDVQKVFTNLG